jgi:hypothetical protein
MSSRGLRCRIHPSERESNQPEDAPQPLQQQKTTKSRKQPEKTTEAKSNDWLIGACRPILIFVPLQYTQ